MAGATGRTVIIPIKIEKGSAMAAVGSSYDFSDNYDLKEKLGKGAFGTVKRCVRKSTGEEFAAKIITTARLSRREKKLIHDEAKIGQRLRHRNIVRLHESIQEPRFHFFVLELLTGGELFEDIVARGFYSEVCASKCLQQVLEALAYCHSKGIIHRDLKPENLLLSRIGEGASVKIADFGLAVQTSASAGQAGSGRAWHGLAGTPPYMAPEFWRKRPYDEAVDVWACGVIMYVLLAGYLPFFSVPGHIKAGAYEFHSPEWDSVSQEAKALIGRMLTVDPERRIGAEAALAHPWIGRRDGAASTAHRPVTITCLRMFNARRKFKGAVIAALAQRRISLTAAAEQPEDINIGEIGSFTKPLRISYFKGLRRLRDEDFRPIQRIEVKSGQMFQAFQRGLGLKNEVQRPRQKSSPSHQKDRANFVNVKVKVSK